MARERVPPDQQDRQREARRRRRVAAHPAPAPEPIQPQSPFAGKGLFTTNDARAASNHPCDWVALQKDPEGDPAPVILKNAATIMWWQARPTLAVVDEANQRGVPYIAQAESLAELEVALQVGASGWHVPHALVGNPGTWTDNGFARALVQEWDLILEWYWNDQPNYDRPDAAHYPRFVNVCFGIYDSGDRRVPLAAYRQVWQGSFSVWKAEAMNETDWAVFDAA